MQLGAVCGRGAARWGPQRSSNSAHAPRPACRGALTNTAHGLRSQAACPAAAGVRSAPLQWAPAAQAAALRGRTAAAAAAAQAPVPQLPASDDGPLLLWFKHDLRLADHPGVAAAAAAAAAGRRVIPYFCLDPQLFSALALTPSGPAALLAGLARLRQQLRDAGSDLVVRMGPVCATTAELAGSTGVGRILFEREEESRWLEAGHRLAQQLQLAGLATRMSTWQAPLWPAAGFDPNFRTWRQRRGAPLAPLPAPGALPSLPAGLEPGALPSLEELTAMLHAAVAPWPADSSSSSGSSSSSSEPDVWGGERGAAWQQVLDGVLHEPAQLPQAGAVAQLVSLLAGDAADEGGAPLSPEQLLTGYLQAADGARPTDARLAFLAQAVAALEGPAARGASFPALLGPLVQLGLLSARQVHSTALAVEAARWGGRLPPLLGPSTPTARAALSAVELSDFHRALASHIPQEGDDEAAAAGAAGAVDEPVASASASFDEGPDGVEQWGVIDWPRGVPRRCNWRWRGALTDFCVVEPEEPLPGAPALVLIHGFGAFGDQWRGNLGPLAAAGYTVYAPTLPGFGRSEKAALQYSQNAWRDFVRDFLLCVVRRPAVLAGNSIGGFCAASAAADYPSLVAGLALINSAGPVMPGATPADVEALLAQPKTPPPPWVVRLMTAGLMTYLQTSIAKQLTWLYPTHPERADAWLEAEIYRAACDARSADVFASVFYLPRPRPLNYLVSHLFRGPAAVIQGVLDPLNDADARASQLESECPGLRAWRIQAGHCPHDEAPEAVNAALLEFVRSAVLQRGQAAGGEAQQPQPAAVAAAASSG